ncbi:hypothetical protein CSV86_014825 [Pseudomonas putida CSV86]|uniref:Uncharacterized protein n=1 Tax=Pseudomonas bharatica CSV86 TaxID=1005395 RepID=L1M4A4_9PSED|nr:hypothetical protein [Pseudomonas bharatica]NNJ16400.1 hypothetical protein [Pseudomonas bharatica CSV86]
MIQEFRRNDAIKAVKYAAQMAIATGCPWGVYRNFKTSIIAMPTLKAKKDALEVCTP